MGTKCAVKCANLIVAYLEEKIFLLLPTVYPRDFVAFFIKNFFRFLDDLFMKWLRGFNTDKLFKIFDELDPKLKFIFSELALNSDYLDISLKIRGEIIRTTVYSKPTDSFNYLHYDSCHPTHTKDHIAISLAKRIIRIASDIIDRETKLDELKSHLIDRGHPTKAIDFAFTKVFSPKMDQDKKNLIVFKSTYNPKHVYKKVKITKSLDRLVNNDMKKAFTNYKVMSTYRQPKSLRNLLIRSKFDSVTPVPLPRQIGTRRVGLFSCNSCVYCGDGLVHDCDTIRFGQYNQYKWRYQRCFTCNSINVIYLIKCGGCWEYYIGQTKFTKKRLAKHKSDIYCPQNSFCKDFCEHVRACTKLKMPLFTLYPLFYEDDESKRRFMEKRFIKRFKPTLNGDS